MHRYPPSTIHIYLDLPSTQRIHTYNSHRHNTIQPLQTLFQAPYPIPTYTTANKTQTHVQHFPCSHRIGKAQTQSSHPLSTHAAPSQRHTHLTHSINSSDPTHDTHPQHKQQYTHHSHSNHRIHIGYHDNVTDRPKTTT